MLKRIGSLIIFLLLFVVPVHANTIESVEMWVDIQNNGSANIKEVWEINITNGANTEWYAAKHNLDNMDIENLVVAEIAADGSIIQFETLPDWNVKASREEKAGKCGLLQANGGYEVCWGFGTLGHHKYIITYTITNLVKGYQGGDAMCYNFLSEAAGGADKLNIYLILNDAPMEFPQTRVWVYGFKAQSEFKDDGISVLSQGRFSQSDYATVLLAFDPGILSPADLRSETLEDIIALNMSGSIWENESRPLPSATARPSSSSRTTVLHLSL